MNKLFDLAAVTAVTVFTTGATIFFAKATGNGVKKLERHLCQSLGSKQHLNPQRNLGSDTIGSFIYGILYNKKINKIGHPVEGGQV